MKLQAEACSLTYISAACNSNPFASDCSEHNVICVGIGNGIGILKHKLNTGHPGKIEKTLFAHSQRVNAVKWIRNFNNTVENSFVSASVDTTAIVWTHENDEYVPKYVLKGHVDAVIDVNAVSFNLLDGAKCVLVATFSIDTLMLWKKTEHDDEFSLLDKYSFAADSLGVSGIAFALLPGTRSIILACPKKFVDICLYTSHLSLQKIDSNSHVFEEKQILSGHTNWINDLTFTDADEGKTLLLASASHDCTIRIWRIVQKEETDSKLNLLEYTVFVENRRFSITTYSILHGHELWIYTLQWKHFEKESEEENKLKLLSVSADKSILIWKRDLKANTWVENHRLGNIGGNISGFLGGSFDATGQFVMAHDLLGAFHVWKYDKQSDKWLSEILPSGHNDEVTDVQWDPSGGYLISVSTDKTTRLHAPWIHDPSCWYEFARPQTHGHVISCLTVLPHFRFVSGAAEKELRSFVAPKVFIKNFKTSLMYDVDESKYPHNSAILPTLDLSNKPADEVEHAKIEGSQYNGVHGTQNRDIPTEDELARTTLWPEIQKLYYHPNEISCITSTLDGSLIASACKANSPKEASIIIWSVKKWEEIERIQELWFHQLTVTQLAFSPCGLYLLSVARDRSWNLFRKNENKNIFQSVAFTSKTNGIHKRQLNCCTWSHDSKYFATGSRDGKLVIWSKDENHIQSEEPNSSTNGYSSKYVLAVPDESVSSVSFAPNFVKTKNYLFAAGFSSGKIGLYIWDGGESQCSCWMTLCGNIAHHKNVTRIVFRPYFGLIGTTDKQNILQLASSGADRLVKIYNINVSAL